MGEIRVPDRDKTPPPPSRFEMAELDKFKVGQVIKEAIWKRYCADTESNMPLGEFWLYTNHRVKDMYLGLVLSEEFGLTI